ncbi:MAG: CotH kinase family protein [Algoriphagus sp.]|uniref:CotH kinase family protein n=1 Tax=Algoriphagus sp. TaxID=1872435 RepID=UPI002731B6E9|nr:CotH kinase family protein [Algoriphagus sp.]MDP2041293.1 CotH kinase family protein [Algoriphagus sp.]MDP3472476.1 CotH kinase family protein [Algoriphagus sp.]
MRKKSSLHSSYWLIWLVSLLLFVNCKEPFEQPVSKGDDGQLFAIDTEQSELPYLVIDTRGAEIPYEPGVLATMKIYQRKKLVQEQKIDIEFRGKTSFRLSDKRGFNLETVDASGEGMDVSFFGMPEEEDWRLIGHVVNLKDKYIWDKSLIYNSVAYELSRKIGKYASRGKFVEVEVNGEYLGLYFFCEKLKRDSNRIDIKSLNATATNLTGGYILKIDKSDAGPENEGKPLSYFMSNWNDDARYTSQNSFRSAFDIFGKPLSFPAFQPPYHPQQFLETYFNYEYPKAENITPAQKTFISNYILDFEKALLADDFGTEARTYTQFIDVRSFVDYFIINELCRNVDAYRISTFLQKDRDGKLAMGPVWDFNIGFDEAGRIPDTDFVINYNDYVKNDPWMVPFWWDRLLADPQFKRAVKERWTALKKSELSTATLTSTVDEMVALLQKNGAVKRNYAKWDQGIGVNYDQSIQSLKQFLINRSSWMDGQIGGW